jgi:hypothetical protein
MPFARDSLWRGREWLDLPDMQAGAIRWCVEVAGVRHHRSLDGAQPLAVFEAVEADALIALPAASFELASWSRPKIGPDCHARVGKPCTPSRGVTSAATSTPGKGRGRWSSSSTGPW